MLQRLQLLQAQHSIPGRSCCQIPPLRAGPGKRFFPVCLKPGTPALTSPCPQRLGVVRGLPGPLPGGQQSLLPATVPCAPTPMSACSLIPRVLARAERAEEGSQCRPLSTAIRAGVSTSEQSPRPDVSAGTRTRARCCAPRGTQALLARRPCLVTLRVLGVPARKAVCCPSIHKPTTRQGFREGVGRRFPDRS